MFINYHQFHLAKNFQHHVLKFFHLYQYHLFILNLNYVILLYFLQLEQLRPYHFNFSSILIQFFIMKLELSQQLFINQFIIKVINYLIIIKFEVIVFILLLIDHLVIQIPLKHLQFNKFLLLCNKAYELSHHINQLELLLPYQLKHLQDH